MDGKFIVFEGLDGSGKTTQIQLLEQHLQKQGHAVVVTAEPTVSALGGMIRDALCDYTHRSTAEIAALFMADRVQHNVNPVWGIQKLLSQGHTVLCDRYYYSSMAYQGSLSDWDWVADMNLRSPEIRKPDLCIFLDVDYERSLNRMESGNRVYLEIYENSEMLIQTRKSYFRAFEQLKGRDNIVIIDATRSIEEVAADIAGAADRLFDE